MTSPLLRGNSLYTLTGVGTWTDTQAQAVDAGGNLVTINDDAENNFLVENYYAPGSVDAAWIGYYQTGSNSGYRWVSGENSSYTNWAPGHPDFPSWEFYAHIDLYPAGAVYGGGRWADSDNNGFGNQGLSTGIAEIPLSLSITRSATPKEGAGLFTTSLNLSAGTTTNLANGTTVYWKVTGVTAEDLASGALTGSGTITSGKLDIQHSLVKDSDTGENFGVSVFSDAEMTQQVGTTSSVAIQEDTTVPVTPVPTPPPTTPTPPAVEEVIIESVRSGTRVFAQPDRVDEIILAPKSFKTGKPDIIVGFDPQQDSLPLKRDSFRGLTSNRLTVVATRKQIKQSNAGINKTKLVYNSKNGQILFDQNGRREGLGVGGIIARLERLGDGRFPLLSSSDLPLI